MPKGLNLKNFGRRKSSGNALDFDEPEAATAAPSGQSTFRVIERPEKKTTSSYGAQRDVRFNSPLRALRGKSADDLGLGQNRGSGGTTNSGSSGYYDSSSASARHSSTSTLPSSVEQDRDDELFAPVRKSQTTGMYHSIGPNNDSPPLPPPPSFSTRAARALSFGNKSNNKISGKDIPPVPPPHAARNGAPLYPQRSQSPHRERAMTTSSYASTAVPTKADLHLSVDGLGTDDFGSMFDSLKKSNPTPPPPAASSFNPESQPMFPPRTYSRSPNGLTLAQSRSKDNDSPSYSDRRDSNEALMSNSSALSSPNTMDGSAPGPAVGNGIAQAFLGNSQSGYSRVPERYTSPGPERASIESYSSVMDDEPRSKEPEFPSRQTQIDDEDRWVRRIELRDPQGSNSPSPVRAKPMPPQRQQLNTAYASTGAPRGGAVSPKSSTGSSTIYAESNNTTPRAARSELRTMPEGSVFDSSPAGPPSAAIRPGAHQRTESGGMKKMTKAQFQALQRRGESSGEQSEEEDLSGDEYDDEDDVDRAKKMATQRRKQEANMSVYRQQMKKVTGGGPTDLPSSAASTVRPSMDRGSSAPAGTGLHFGGIGGTPPADSIRGKPSDDEDDDVPLGILQAHGFPTSSRPPTRMGENDLSHQRRTSVAGSVVGGGGGQGNLPPFARRLPADPYFGAGLVNQSTRESLAMNSTAGSVVGMPTGPAPQMQQQAPSMGHPGGLVGVIAGEERARAARRGSPNMATGTYNNPMGGPMPLPGNMSMQQPQMPRTMSMGNLAPPSMYGGAPPMPPMPQMPQMMPQMQQGMLDPGQQQMQQFMQMQMQLMQNMLAMQQQQMGHGGPQTPTPQPPQQAGDYLGVNFGNNGSRPMSMASNHSNLGPPPPNQGRAMTMMNPPPSWNQAPAAGPRPNSAMPSTGNSYAPSVSGMNIAGGPAPGYTPSIAPSERSNIGMPSRYRPVTQLGDTSRSQSMTSSMTLQAFANQQAPPSLGGTSYNGQQSQAPKPTIRVVDKPKGGPKTATPRASVDDEDDGWAEMRKKREDKKRSKWSKKSSTTENGVSLKDLYQGLE